MIYDISFKMNESLYLRDPQSTDLGKKIIGKSIEMIFEMGIESFNFRKLAQEIQSTETSVYRYFDNKHLLLLFLTSWYWEWVSYLIDINTKNIEVPAQKLKIILKSIIIASENNALTPYVNENFLYKVVVQDGSKAYHTHNVDIENKSGMFLSYKNLVDKVAAVICDINPEFPYAYSLASNIFEMSSNQVYFAEHLPRLTDVQLNKGDQSELLAMMEYFVFKLIARD